MVQRYGWHESKVGTSGSFTEKGSLPRPEKSIETKVIRKLIKIKDTLPGARHGYY